MEREKKDFSILTFMKWLLTNELRIHKSYKFRIKFEVLRM